VYLINVLRNESHSLLNVNNIMKSWIILDGLNLFVQTCRNPNFGLTTKAGFARLWAKREAGSYTTYSRECEKV
jgi:hypothetical protein